MLYLFEFLKQNQEYRQFLPLLQWKMDDVDTRRPVHHDLWVTGEYPSILVGTWDFTKLNLYVGWNPMLILVKSC